ncbi:SpoIIE family protein phosphatase [Kineococcus rubinsiae]|uniref:SpoIIE family protein phosphatase n=1 Tax=Kineococcus rubinsiae TaxID=2609562 RepID=UPI00142F7558|nr:SpoIIE family protein phosphatase [Kineococcus rubinsiae]NIZ91918.1 SpoIIE family protein phosphatase [Kineococcus rubinsiae]
MEPRSAPASRGALHVHLLQRTATELAAALDVAGAVSAVLRSAHAVLGTSSCGVSVHDPDSDLLLPQLPDAVDGADPYGPGHPVPLDSSTPSAEAARTARPVLIRSVEELRTRFDGGLNDLVVATGELSWAMVPMLARGRLVGVLRFGFDRPGSLDELELEFATALAGQCALAVERAELLDTARDAVQAAARSEQRYRTLAEAGSLDVFTAEPGVGLTSDLPGWRALTRRDGPVMPVGWRDDVHPDDLPAVIETWNRAAVEGTRLAYTLRLRTPDGWRWISTSAVPVRAEGAGSDAPVQEWIGSAVDVTERVRGERRTRTLQALTSALASVHTHDDVVAAVLAAAVDGADAVRAALTVLPEDPGGHEVPLHTWQRDAGRQPLDAMPWSGAQHLEVVAALEVSGGAFLTEQYVADDRSHWAPEAFADAVARGEVAWALLPLCSRPRQVGVLLLSFDEPQPEDAAEREFLAAFARQAATALERQLLSDAERSTASILQEALQPGPLPAVDWLQAHRRTATSVGSEVGGDWAEIIALDDDLVAVVLGDVMGRGARAATAMGEVRTQVRTLALIDPRPSAVLRGLDQCFAVSGTDDLVTLFYGLLSADGHLRAASAGHLPPLVADAAGSRYLDVPPGVPLGVAGDERADVLDVHLQDGTVFCVFSDGLVETRTRGLTEGLDAALAVLGDAAGRCEAGRPGAQDTAAAVADELMTELGRGVEVDDDVTVLVLRLLGAER